MDIAGLGYAETDPALPIADHDGRAEAEPTSAFLDPGDPVDLDDALLELASTKPTPLEELGRSRLLLREGRKPEIAEGILAAIKAGLAVKPEDCPKVDGDRDAVQVDSALADLLRVLLKEKSESAGVAQKLIATSSDLDALAAGDRAVDAL